MADKYGNMETTDFGNLQLFIVIWKYLSKILANVLTKNYWSSFVLGSMKGCALGTLEKCYGFSFGETPENMTEVRILFAVVVTKK